MMIYLLAKARQKCKQRRNLIVILPLNMVHQPCINNLQFNPIIVKSKIFIFYSLSYSMMIIFIFIFFKLKIVVEIEILEVLLINFYVSIIIPVSIYLKNSSLRKYLWNELLNNLCLWMFSNYFSTLKYKTLNCLLYLLNK